MQFVVENRSGAGGAIGGEAAARATPDGYTLLMASSSTMSINPHFAAKQSYDPQTSFSPVILVGYATNVVAVHPSVPVRTIRELIALAKSKPGEISYASNGTGTISHLTGELFMQQAGVKSVAFIGFSDALGDLAYDSLMKSAAAADIKVVANERYARSDSSVAGQVLKIVAATQSTVKTLDTHQPLDRAARHIMAFSA